MNTVRKTIKCPICRETFPLPSGLINWRLRLASRSRLAASPKLLRVGNLVFNPATYDATRGGKKIALTRIESRLLDTLMRHSGRVVSRTVLIRLVWGSSDY